MSRIRLLKLVVLLAVTALIILPLYSILIIVPSYSNFITDHTEKGLINLASQMVEHEDFNFQISTDSPLPETLIVKIKDIKETVGLWKVKIFTTEGVIVHSTDLNDIGNVTRKNFFPEMLANNQPHTKMEDKIIHNDSGEVEKLHLIETYVPIISEGKAIGAFEIYFDVTDIQDFLSQSNEKAQRVMFLIVIGLLAGILLTAYWARNSTLKLEMSEYKFKTLSVTDSLTGLLNRRGFIKQAERQLEIANRGNKYFHLVFIDINNFKSINDNFGHEVGDNALTEISNILTNTFRASDIIGRLGGDEFAVLTTQHSKLTSESSISKRLNKNVKSWNLHSMSDYNISLSFGIVPYIPNSDFQLDDLLSRADDLMYEAKKELVEI